jgi:isochorismate hydrolase
LTAGCETLYFGMSVSDPYQAATVNVAAVAKHYGVEATVRFAAELGYEVTVVKDATADYSAEEMHAALDINIQNYASALVTTKEVSIRSLLSNPFILCFTEEAAP